MTQQIYVAHCIEDGERFTSTFKTKETNKEKLYDIGQELASDWGAECMSVKKFSPEKLVKVTTLDGSKKPFTKNKKSFDAYLKKNYPNAVVTYPLITKTQRVDMVDGEVPSDVFDYDNDK